jgi:hypothetical protein
VADQSGGRGFSIGAGDCDNVRIAKFLSQFQLRDNLDPFLAALVKTSESAGTPGLGNHDLTIVHFIRMASIQMGFVFAGDFL